uniref:Peptidase S1 domain-containing protein n=1 Tax=Globodera pallida TaxID=36090 RepID=A0A183BND7_GLOPA
MKAGIGILVNPDRDHESRDWDFVTLGDADLRNLPQLGIQGYIKPDKFRKAIDFENDIALLELKTPIVMDWQINRICLPSVYLAGNGHAAYVLGYGWTRGARDKNGTRPATAPTTILREDLIVLRKSPPCPPSMLCNIQASRQTQAGDSGGPLMREVRGKWYLLGVTKGHSCNSRSCFTRITPHCNWISDKTNGDVKCYGNIV